MRFVDWLRAVPRRIRQHRFHRQHRWTQASRRANSVRQVVGELLESRQLPSAVSFTGTSDSPGVLSIDVAEAGATSVAVYSTTVTTANGAAEVVRVAINGSVLPIRQASTQSTLGNLPVEMVGRIVIRGTDNSDTIDLSGITAMFGLQQVTNATSRPMPNDGEFANLSVPSFYGVFALGFGGDDRVNGSLFNDFVDAGAGRDTVLGQAGDDGIVGGEGNDILAGSLGDDFVSGGAGSDVLVGGFGRDAINGGDGDDLLIGATVAFDGSLVSGLQDLRDRWAAAAVNPEARRQAVAPVRTTVLGVDDNRDGVLDRDTNNKVKDVGSASTRLVVPQSMANAFDPATYGSTLPSGSNFLARIDNETVRVVSRVVTADPDTDVIVVARGAGGSTTLHDSDSTIVAQAILGQSPLQATSLWSAPLGTVQPQTLFEDFLANTLTGGAGNDFFVTADELLTFGDTQGDPKLNADDVVTDLAASEDRYHAVNPVPDSKRLAVPTDGAVQPGFGETIATLHGTITRLGGDPGTEFLASDRIGAEATVPYVWGGVVRTNYVTNPSYNVTSDLVHLGSFPSANGGPNEQGQTKFDFLLQRGDTTASLSPMTADFPSRNWRWSQNPAEPNVEYGFVSGVGPNGQSSGVQKYQFLTATDAANETGLQQLYEHSSQTLVFTSFDPVQVGGLIFVSKSTIYFNPETGHNYMLLAGNPRRVDRPNEFDRSVLNAYIVDLDVVALANTPENSGKWADPVVASFPISAPSGTDGFPYGSLPANIDDFYFSPDGQYVMVVYTDDTGAGFRLLDVNWQTGTMSSHVIPVTPQPDEDIPQLRTEAARQNGFFPFRWHHPVFATGASGKTYIVGQPGKWSKDNLVSPNIQYLAGGSVIGQLVRFDPLTNKYASLTNPAFENITASRETLSHVSATNTQNPGYVFVSYYPGDTPFSASSPAYKGAIVAVNIEQPTGPDGAIVLARHQTQYAGNYIAQPMVNASSDGTKVLFHSTWGDYQQVISTYEINLGSRVELAASGSAVLRRTGTNSVALFESLTATTPIAGTQRNVATFDTLVVTTTPGASLQLTLDMSAGSPVPTGGVLEFNGTNSTGDQLKLANAGKGGPWSWSLTGDGAGQLRGSTAGLVRFRGIESLIGGEGTDHFALADGATWHGLLSGGAGSDSLSFRAFTTDVTASLLDGTASFLTNAGAFAAQINQFESLFGGSGNDHLTGDNFANSLEGGSGNDIIDGGAGDDTIDGGAGDDSLNGQSGNDVIDAGEGNDNVRGGNGNDLLQGGAGNDSVFGQNDNDVITGGLGNDSLDGGDGIDFLVESGDVNFVLTTISMTGGLGADSVRDIELAQLTGGDGNNVLNASGFAGSVTLFGGLGNDELWDGAGNDSLVGGLGNDTYKLSAVGDDVVIETASGGNDVLDYSVAVGGVNVDLTRAARQDVRAGHQLTLGTETEQFRGSAFADVVTLSVAGALVGQVDGGANGDTSVGDTLQVTSGANTWTLTGSSTGLISSGSSVGSLQFSGFESLSGGSGNDRFVFAANLPFQGAIDGGLGLDVLDWSQLATGRSVLLTETTESGFSGREASLPNGFRNIKSLIGSSRSIDTLSGLAADSTWDLTAEFLIELSTGRRLDWDLFEVFQGGLGRDTFFNVRSSVAITLSGGAGDDLLDASLSTRDITLFGDDGNDDLRGGSGADRLEGGGGNDTLSGGSGNDSLAGQAGNDVLDDVFGNNTLSGGADIDSLRIIGLWSLAADSQPAFSDVEQIVGGGVSDMLVGSSLPESFLISGDGVTVSDLPFRFIGFEFVQGGSGVGDSVKGTTGDDVFGVMSNGLVTAYGTTLMGFEAISGGGGSDRLQGDDSSSESFSIGSTGVSVLGNSGLFLDFEVLAGGGGNDSIIGPSLSGGAASVWSITGNDQGVIAGLAFEQIETLRGGLGDDTFVFSPGATIDRIEGGGGTRNMLDYANFTTPITVNFSTFSATGIGFVTQLNGVRGGQGDDSLVGGGTSEWFDGGVGNDTINGQGGDDTVTGGLGFDLLSGGAGLSDVLLDARDVNWLLTNLSLSVNGQVEDTVSGFERAVLSGGDGANSIQTTGFTGAVTLNGGAGDDTLGSASPNDVLDGGAGNDALSVSGTWSLTATGLPVSVKSIETVFGGGTADSLMGTIAADWFAIGADGTITTTLSSLKFVGFEILSGGSSKVLDSVVGTAGDDTFTMTPTGGVILNGVTLLGFECVSGEQGTDRLVGSDKVAETFSIDLKGVIVSSALTTVFTGFESLDGGTNLKPDTFNGSVSNDLFELTEPGVVTYSGFQLRGFEIINGGTGADRVQGSNTVAETFVVSTLGVSVVGWGDMTFTSVEQLLAGDGNVQDVVTGSAGNETFSVDPTGTVKFGGILLTGFEVVSGGDGADRLAGSNTLADVFRVTDSGVKVDGVNGVTFRGFETLSGNGGNDSLIVSDGGVLNGTFDGGLGIDVVDFSGSTQSRFVALTGSSATGFAGRESSSAMTFLVTESLKGGSGSDTLTGLNVLATWDIAGKQYKDNTLKIPRILKWDSFESFLGGNNIDTFNNAAVSTSITLDGGAGNDVLDASLATAPMVLLGGDGNDVLRGGRAADSLEGGTGDDRLIGGIGNDRLLGGGGNDVLEGGDGDDTLIGNNGNDQLAGQAGNDLLEGGAGLDVLDGADGDDTLFGGLDNDTLRGGAGNDCLSGYLGNDLLQGQDGNDTLVGGSDADNLDGGLGNDVLAPRAGNGTLESDIFAQTSNIEDLLILTAYVLDSEYNVNGLTLRPFEWLGADWQG